MTAPHRWSWRIAVIAGTPIRVHATLVLLLGWIAVSYSIHGVGPEATLLGVLLVVVVFAIIGIHGFAHAFVAGRFGVRTREILLLPIGGIASLERVPERPIQELAVALVGPAVNLGIAAVIWLAFALDHLEVRAPASTGAAFAAQLLWINVVLALFNLLPAFPMDGGRALRAILAMRLGRYRATEIAGALGRFLAIAIAVAGLLFDPWLVLIAGVVWLGAKQEVAIMQFRTALAGVPAGAAMNQSRVAVTSGEQLGEAARRMIATGQNQIPIVDREVPIGVLTRGDAAAGIAQAGATASVATAPHHDAIAVAPDEPLDIVLDKLVRAPDAIAIVLEHGAAVGVITAEQLATFVSLHPR